MVAADEPNSKKHMELESVPNLQVIKLMQSLASRGYVRKSYTWNHYYWFLTNEGITYLREYLSLPEMIVPNTHKKQQVNPARHCATVRCPPPSSKFCRDAFCFITRLSTRLVCAPSRSASSLGVRCFGGSGIFLSLYVVGS